MVVYKVVSQAERDGSLVFAETVSSYDAYLFDGKPQTNWQGLTLKWYEDDNLKTIRQDFALIIGAGVNLALSEKAKSIIQPLLKDDAEYLPITIEGCSEQWYLINIINIVENALDLERCEFSILRSGKVGALKRAVFNENTIPENRAFVYPQAIDSFMFKGEELKNICKQYNLKGLDFFPMNSIDSSK